MRRDEQHVKMRTMVETLVEEGFSDEVISQKLNLQIGERYLSGTVRWYRFCIAAKQNQRKAFEKLGYKLYSDAGRIAQKKHPWIGHELGKKYGSIQGKERIKRLIESGKAREYFSTIAKKLQDVNPEQSRRNMKKAHETMKMNGEFYSHQKEATLKCMQKHPSQLKEMSKRAHELYPDLAYRSRKKQRENAPYWYMGCAFDSNQERAVCKLLMDHNLIDIPIEGKNVQFRVKNYGIDFFLKEMVFLEFHPPIRLGDKMETEESYYNKRRKILDENGFKDYPLIVIPHIDKAEKMIKEIEETYLK